MSEVEQRKLALGKVGGIVAAAMALPGLMPATAQAENAPEQGVIGLKYLQYKDYQPGFDRIDVKSPSLYFLVPYAGKWSLEGSLVSDQVSGATPRHHSSIASASPMTEDRRAEDVRLTRYFDRSAYSVGISHSSEHDYASNSVSGEARFASEDNNTTFNVGVAATEDTIDPTDGGYSGDISGKSKRTREFIVGVTQVLTPDDIAQINLQVVRGRGYFSDPYKFPDNRPDTRNAWVIMARWNHHVDAADASLRTSYRYYSDSWDINAHTFGVEWDQPLSAHWSVIPSVRYYTQSAAKFYFDPVFDPVLGEPYPVGYVPGMTVSGDQRLSAFGAITVGAKLVWNIDRLWTVDFKGEYYQQRDAWRLGGKGSPGLDPFKAQFYQFGIARKF